jgi:hypothetical protein
MLGPAIWTALLCIPPESVCGRQSRATQHIRVIVMRCEWSLRHRHVGFEVDTVDTRLQ